jgi:ATP-dependent Lhr-like helicase
VLLTAPESLEGMLVSVNVDHRACFADLRTVVVDEVHACGGASV